jgi:predicted nucleotidyltransferase
VREPGDAGGEQRAVERLLAAVCEWARGEPRVAAVALVGSWARGAARPDSDVDLVVLTAVPDAFLGDAGFADRFGRVAQRSVECFGRVTALRVHYAGGPELELGFATPDWAAAPLDAGTRRVAADGLRALFDPGGLLDALSDGAGDAPPPRRRAS